MKYDLVGINSNTFSIMGYVTHAMRECGNYDHLLAVSVDMVDKINDQVGDTEEDA